jgi:hypothetical protein
MGFKALFYELFNLDKSLTLSDAIDKKMINIEKNILPSSFLKMI